MVRSVSCPKAVWSPLFSLPSQVIWGCSERTGAGTQETWTLLCLLCLLKSLSLLPHPYSWYLFLCTEWPLDPVRMSPGGKFLSIPARWAWLPAEHGEALAVVPARGSDGSQGHPSPEGRHPPLPGTAGLGVGLAQGQGHAVGLKQSGVTVRTCGSCSASLFCCWGQQSSF